ncbi:MAG: hypothetical protein ACQERR_06005 [Pseudomonadota bacterium]
MVSILQNKQRQQGAEQVITWVHTLLDAEEINLVQAVWDMGQLDMNKQEHTLTIITEGGVAKDQFEARELEDSFTYVKPVLVERLREMLKRLRTQEGVAQPVEEDDEASQTDEGQP